jgi:hypothetical protein
MRSVILLLPIAFTFVGAAHAAQPPADVARLIAQLEPLNDACRGGSGDSPATQKACAQRDRKFSQIVKAGWCLGPDSAPAYQKTWMACPGRSQAPAASSGAVCPMFKGPTAVVCHDREAAAVAFERFGFDAAALSRSHMPAYLQKFGCTPVATDAANRISWVSDPALDSRTARASGWLTIAFVKRADSGPNVGAWAVATDYLNSACRAASPRS